MSDLVNVDTFDFKHCIVVEKRLVLVYTGHKYKIDICDPKSKSKACFYLFGGKSMNYKQSVKKIQAGIEEKLAHQFGKKRKQLQDVQYYKAVAPMVKEMLMEGRGEFLTSFAEIQKDLLSLHGIFKGRSRKIICLIWG